MKHDDKSVKTASGHRGYIFNECPLKRKKLLRKKRKGYEACQKLNLCAACYNKKVRQGFTTKKDGKIVKRISTIF